MKLESKKKEIAGKMSHHDEREIKDYVKFNPNSLKFPKTKQRGRSSLNTPKGETNEGNRMMEGSNENNRQ